MAKPAESTALDTNYAKAWLAELKADLRHQPGEGPRAYGMRCFLVVEQRLRLWDESRGQLSHALAILAFDEGVPVDPKHGPELVLVHVAVPAQSKQAASAWAKALRAIRDNQLGLDEVVSTGIYQAVRMIGKPPAGGRLLKGGEQVTAPLVGRLTKGLKPVKPVVKPTSRPAKTPRH